PVADCTAAARSPRNAARTTTAISSVAAAMPIAIHGARAPAVSKGLSCAEDGVPPKPLVAIAAISTPVVTIRTRVARPIGRLVSFRSVRYQCPRNNPSLAAPRNAAPAASWNSDTREPCRPVAAMTARTARETGTETIPTTRPNSGCRRRNAPAVAVPSTATASASEVTRLPVSPATAPEDAANHAGHANSSVMRTLKRVKYERFVSFQSGESQVNVAAPANVSASTRARTPATPVTRTIPRTTSTSRHRVVAAARRRILPSFTASPVPLPVMDDWRSYDDVAVTYERV